MPRFREATTGRRGRGASLLEDDDTSVRSAACEAIPRIAELSDEDTCEKLTAALTPAAAALASDESPDCRASLAKTSGLLLQALGNDPDAALKARDEAENSVAPLDRALFPLLLILVNDEAPSVACTALRGLADCGAGLARVLGTSTVSMPSQTRWRTCRRRATGA